MKRPAALTAAVEKIKNEPVVASQLVGFGFDMVIGLGAPVTADLKLAAVGMVTTIATLFGRSKSTAVNKLVTGEVLQSGPGEPVTVIAPDGATTTMGA
jgi:hypothetical protein